MHRMQVEILTNKPFSAQVAAITNTHQTEHHRVISGLLNVQLRPIFSDVHLDFCQAQFQLASPVLVELSLALSLIITTHPPGKVEKQQDKLGLSCAKLRRV